MPTIPVAQCGNAFAPAEQCLDIVKSILVGFLRRAVPGAIAQSPGSSALEPHPIRWILAIRSPLGTTIRWLFFEHLSVLSFRIAVGKVERR